MSLRTSWKPFARHLDDRRRRAGGCPGRAAARAATRPRRGSRARRRPRPRGARPASGSSARLVDDEALPEGRPGHEAADLPGADDRTSWRSVRYGASAEPEWRSLPRSDAQRVHAAASSARPRAAAPRRGEQRPLSYPWPTITTGRWRPSRGSERQGSAPRLRGRRPPRCAARAGAGSPARGLGRLGGGTADPERARERDRGGDRPVPPRARAAGLRPAAGRASGARDGRSPDRPCHALVKGS